MLAITEPRGELRYRSYALYGLGVALWQQGTPDRAAELLKESLRLKLMVKDALSAGFTLDALAWIVADAGDHERAAHLLGAAESLNQSTMVPTADIPNMRKFHERCEQQSRAALGEKRFQAAFRSGSELTFAQAVGYALGEKPSAAPAPVDGSEPGLTRRERQVADLVADGLTNREIAARLVISHRTAEGHVERILSKLGFGTRAQVAAWVATHPRSS